MKWSPEDDAEILRFRARGLSAAQIAKKVKGRSREAICARLWRLDGKDPDKQATRRRNDKKVYAARPARTKRTSDWDVDTFEPYEIRKLRLAQEKATT